MRTIREIANRVDAQFRTVRNLGNDINKMDRTSVCLIALLAVLAAAIAQEEMYPDTYDHIDADEILSNEALRVEYYNCLMDTGPCASDEQQFLKSMILFYICSFHFKCLLIPIKEKYQIHFVIIFSRRGKTIFK